MIAVKYRFHGHGSLKYVYKNGQAIRSRYFTARFIKNPHRKLPRFAVVISKKVHKSAVGRNRVRRRVYERLRLDLLPKVSGVDVVIIATNGEVLSLSAQDMQKNLEELFRQIITYSS